MSFFNFREKKPQKGADNVEVYIPKCDTFTSAVMVLDGKPLVGVFNANILQLSPKIVFGWYLSLAIGYDTTVGDDMPPSDVVQKMQDFSDLLNEKLADDPSHPNAIFLGRVTGNGHTEIMWYVNNPEKANLYLQSLIESHDYPFDFDYQMSYDPEWGNADFWLKPLQK